MTLLMILQAEKRENLTILRSVFWKVLITMQFTALSKLSPYRPELRERALSR